MTPEKYKAEQQYLEMRFKAAKRELADLYSKENNPYRLGDTFTDHAGTIKIVSITYGYGSYNELPYCVYTGIELKKDGTHTKRETIRNAYQTNELKPIKQKQ